MTTILLVDDDPLQAVVRKSTLERRFSNVLRASDAAEAFCLVEEPQFASDLRLVIAGIHLPGIGGPEFVSEMHQRLPSVPILVLGGPDDAEDDYPDQPVRFLAPPTTAQELLTIAGQMLDNSSN